MNTHAAQFETAKFSPAVLSGVMPGSCPPPASSSIVLRHLRTQAEIEAVMHLREEIDLSVHTSAQSADDSARRAREFAALEKKETNWALS